MKCIELTENISVLNLTVRTYHFLNGKGISTIEDLLNFEFEELDVKIKDELESIVDGIKNHHGKFVLGKKNTFIYGGKVYQDDLLTNTELSIRSVNKLKKKGCFISDIIELSDEELNELGSEIHEYVNKLRK